MPTVPQSYGELAEMLQQTPEQQRGVSPTSLLLAAATMHNQGRLTDGDHFGFGGKAMPKFGKGSGRKIHR